MSHQKQISLMKSPINLYVENAYKKIPTDPSISPTSPNTLSLPRSPTSLSCPPRSPTGFDKRSRNHRTGIRQRAVLKNGDYNVIQGPLIQQRYRFVHDLFTTLVDCQWRWTLLAFFMSFIVTWTFYALSYYLSCWAHGDLELLHLPDMQEINGWKPCVVQIWSFTSAFIFSLETQHTIGYGSRAITEECPESIFILCLQSASGVLMQALMVGIVFAKVTRSKNRQNTLLFSKNSVVCRRNGELCLMFRIGDMRKSHIISANIRAQLIARHVTNEGERLNQHQTMLALETEDEGDSGLFFIWPTTVVHRIDKDSPLYEMSAGDIICDNFEVVVILEGTIESTGQTIQARSSYLNTEILWGHRFEPVVVYNKNKKSYEINYNRFENTYVVDTPICSAKELELEKEAAENADVFYTKKNEMFFDFDGLKGKTLSSAKKSLQNHVISIDEDEEFVMNGYTYSRHSLPQKTRTPVKGREPICGSAETLA